MSKKSAYMFTNTRNTQTDTVHSLPPGLKRAQGGFVGLCKRPRKMFSDKLFTIPQSLLGRVLHRAATHYALHLHCVSFARSPSRPPLFLHHSLTLPVCPFLCSVLLSRSLFFVFCDTRPHAPREGPSSQASCR